MRIYLIALSLLFGVLAWSQEYSYQYDKDINPDEVYILNHDSLLYFLQLNKTKRQFEYEVELVQFDKKTQKDISIPMEKKLISIRKGVHVFHWDAILFFVEIDGFNQLLKVSSQSIINDQTKEHTKLFDIRKKEKILTTYQIEHLLYILTTSPKEKAINLYTINLLAFDIKNMTIPIHPKAYKLLTKKPSENIATIDYSTPNSLIKMTRPVKIYQEDNDLTITFDVKENTAFEYNTHIYTIQLKEQQHSHIAIPFEKVRWDAFNSTLYDGYLYRITSQPDLIQIDAVDYQKDSLVLQIMDGKNYVKFNFQKSIAIDELGHAIPKSNELFTSLIKYRVCIFPEIQEGKTIFYIGGVGNAGFSKEDIRDATPYEILYSYNLVNNGTKKNYYSQKTQSSAIFESNIGIGGKIEPIKDLTFDINPKFRKINNTFNDMATEMNARKISIYKMDNQLFGIFYIEYERKFVIKALE